MFHVPMPITGTCAAPRRLLRIGRYSTRVISWIERLASRLSLTDTRPPVDDVRRAAVAAILDGDRVLLMKRTEREGDPWSGHISLPGGRYEPRDVDLLTTAIRETREELGIDLAGARVLGNLEAIHPRLAGPKGFEVTPFVFAPGVALEPHTGPEAAAVFWMPLSVAQSGAIDGTYTYPNTQMTFPCWTYEGHTVWGLTWRILGLLIERAVTS
jgi:8-oxo-dGTP pyrophosphatase MutT (NUDIX family)